MTIGFVLAAMQGTPGDASALETGYEIVRRFNAHLEALHVRPDPRLTVPFVADSISGAAVDEIIVAIEREAEDRARTARQCFDTWRERAGAFTAEDPDGEGPSCAWSEAVGDQERILAAHARTADLTVFGQVPAEQVTFDDAPLIEAVLMESGRPLLLAPALSPSFARTVAIAWNDSAEAARAVAMALPFLIGAEQVTVLVVEEDGSAGIDTTRLVSYLSWHGVRAELDRRIGDGGTVGEVLLRATRERGSDLLVMGAYTHNRLHELVFGGATKHMLSGVPLPVFMMH